MFGGGSSAPAFPDTLRSFYTTFSGYSPASPISEGGVWQHTTNANAFIQTVNTSGPSRAVGTQAGAAPDPAPENFNDSYAYLNGVWRPNVSARAVIFKDPTIDTNFGWHEVEILLRMADTSNSARCYEFNLSSVGGYAQIVRWDGTPGARPAPTGTQVSGDFTPLVTQTPPQVPVTGTVLIASAIGSTLTLSIDYGAGPVQVCQTTDTTWSNGAPGMGMWLQRAAGFADQPMYGFSSYFVTEV